MSIYTFIANYKGGTYICQLPSEDLDTAVRSWRDYIHANNFIPGLDLTDFLDTFDWHIQEFRPSIFQGLVNTWGTDFTVGKKLLELYIIKTEALIPVEV